MTRKKDNCKVYSNLLILFIAFSSLLLSTNITFGYYYTNEVIHGSQCEVDRNGNNPEDIEFTEIGMKNYYTYAKVAYCPIMTTRFYESGDEYYYTTADYIYHWEYCGEDNNNDYDDNSGWHWYYNLQARLCYHDFEDGISGCGNWHTTFSSVGFECNDDLTTLPAVGYRSYWNSVYIEVVIPPKDGSSYSYFSHGNIETDYTL